ncbi:hypothetical protein AALA21_03580 [Eggerthellaceae bacterium 3-80]|nr:hypothetical protein D7W09_03620 [bacterium D16-34]
MNEMTCKKCGSNDFIEAEDYKVCMFCRTRYLIKKEIKSPTSTISVHDDIKMLLEKCKRDPANARRYANLILDINPSNAEARAILGRY